MEVSFVDNTPPVIVHENDLIIIDRGLRLGDIVKQRPEDMMSGTVTSGKMTLSIEHAFTGQILENVNSEHVKLASDFVEGAPLIFIV